MTPGFDNDQLISGTDRKCYYYRTVSGQRSNNHQEQPAGALSNQFVDWWTGVPSSSVTLAQGGQPHWFPADPSLGSQSAGSVLRAAFLLGFSSAGALIFQDEGFWISAQQKPCDLLQVRSSWQQQGGAAGAFRTI